MMEISYRSQQTAHSQMSDPAVLHDSQTKLKIYQIKTKKILKNFPMKRVLEVSPCGVLVKDLSKFRLISIFLNESLILK